MSYEKPEVALIASAVETIQSAGKGDEQGEGSPVLTTISAYEADE